MALSDEWLVPVAPQDRIDPVNRRETMSRRNTLIMLAILGVALAARLLLLGGKSLWADEAYAAALTGMPLREGASLFSRGTPHPIGGFFLIWSSARIFGGSASGIRLLTALLTATAVIPVYGFVRRRIPGGAIWAALCWALSPWSVSLGQEAWVYGPLAALAFWSIYLADGAWRGSKVSFAFFIPVSIAGFLVQHIFIIPATAAVALYFTVPRTERVGLAWPAISTGVLLSAFVPIAATFLDQFSARTRRMAAAGNGGMDFGRFLLRPPSVFLRLWSGGLIPEARGEILAVPLRTAAAVVALLLQAAAVIAALVRKSLRRSFRLWLAGALLLPFVLFLKDDPTPRHFPLAWMVLAVGVAAISQWRKWLGPAVVGFCLLMLVWYYPIDSWPYHESDWEGSVQVVEERALTGDALILLGAKTAMQAWNFYSTAGMERYSPHCTDPYLGEDEAAEKEDPALLLESLLEQGKRVWLVEDHWGGPPMESITGRRTALFDTTFGTMRILLLESSSLPR